MRYDIDGRRVELPVKLKVHDSLFVPLAKWSMLLTGNYRCVGDDAMQSIRDAVHSDLAASRAVYRWVGDLCKGSAPPCRSCRSTNTRTPRSARELVGGACAGHRRAQHRRPPADDRRRE